MGVYIKGLEMPTSCYECPMGDSVRCALMPGVPAWWEEYDQCVKEKRLHSYCPLVPVPEHGRLIDEQWLKDAMITTLESLKKNPKMDRQEMHLIAAFDTLRAMVEDAPTIIPASEEGE